MDGSGSVLYPTTKEIVSEHAFKIVLWVGVGICTAICILRLCIRFVCFRRLLSEDYLILAAWAILIAIATVLQIHLGDLYSMLHVQNRQKLPDINFFVNMRSGLRGEVIAFILLVIGIWLIKLNFMLLFYRIGYQVRSYLILWWVALVLVVGFGAVNLALLPFDCQLGDIMHITMECAKQSRVKEIYLFLILTIVMDVLSDVIIICFPVLIVWNTALSRRQKMVLSSVFLLVSFTIGVTITRGSVFGGVFKAVSKTDRQVIDSVWMAFWWCIEYITSFVIACLVSFRSLWSSGDTARGRKNQAEKYRAQVLAQHIRTPSSLESQRNKRRRFYDSLLDTFSELEGSILDKKSSSQVHLESHLATIDVDFSTWESNHSTDGDDRK